MAEDNKKALAFTELELKNLAEKSGIEYKKLLAKVMQNPERYKKVLIGIEDGEEGKIAGLSKALLSKDFNKILKATTKHKLTKKDFKGKEENETGIMLKWSKKDIDYLVNDFNLPKLEGQAPKVYVSQDKNIKLLLAITENQQYNKAFKKAEAKFTFKKYALLRGYTEEEIKKGGKYRNELRRDLFSGAYTTYRIPIKKQDGKEYILHGSFYSIEEPKNPGGQWTLRFNAWYEDLVLEVLYKEAKGFYIHFLKEIADRKTSENPHLHFFYNQLRFLWRKSRATMPKKIGNLLKDMNVVRALDRPKECYEVLKKCLIYMFENYPEELTGIVLYNNYHKDEKVDLSLALTDSFKDYGYKDFKDLIFSRFNIKDIRDVFISFRRAKEQPEQLELGTYEIINDVINWAKGWEEATGTKIKKTEKQRIKYLNDYIKYMGNEDLEAVFEKEANKLEPNAFEFLLVVLPTRMKEALKSTDT